MKKFNITVDGTAYEVEIEEVGASQEKPAAPIAAAPKAKPTLPPVAPPKVESQPAVAVSAGDTPINAPMPGKIIKLAVAPGDAVKAGDVVLILEAMKMQNEIAAPIDGTVKSFAVAAGQNVKPGEVLAIIG